MVAPPPFAESQWRCHLATEPYRGFCNWKPLGAPLAPLTFSVSGPGSSREPLPHPFGTRVGTGHLCPRPPLSPPPATPPASRSACLGVPRTLAFGPGRCSLSLLAPGLEHLLGPRPASRNTLSNVFRSPPGRKTLLFVACYLHVFGFLAIFYLGIFGTCR